MYKTAKIRTPKISVHTTFWPQATEIKNFRHSLKTNRIQVEIDIEVFKQMIERQRICVADMRCMNTESKRAIQQALGEMLIS